MSSDAIRPAGFFAIRAPLLPFDTLEAWAASLIAPGASPELLPGALAADRERLRLAYRRLVDLPVVRTALFLASRDLDEALHYWLEDPESDRGAAVERTLTRYLTRLAARPTPFGLFASTALGVVNQTTDLAMAPLAACRQHTRLDMDYLVLLVEALERDPGVQAGLRYTPNSSVYRSADRLRYIETRLRGRARSYHLVALEPGVPLDSAMDRARNGATRDELAAAVAGPEIPPDEAEEFIDQLIEAQVVVSDLHCPVTGAEPLAALEAKLREIPGGRVAGDVLSSVSKALENLDEEPLGASTDRYRAIAEKLDRLPAAVDLARLFQVDLVRPPISTLGADVVTEIARGVALLHRLQPEPQPEPHSEQWSDELDRFRAAFAERYEEREVALAEALDEDVGIGLTLNNGGRAPSPLLNDLSFPEPERRTIEWGRREEWLLDRVGRALSAEEIEVSLTPADIEILATQNPRPLPDAFAAMAVAGGRRESGAPARQVWLQYVIGPSGARLLGRFCHGDAGLYARVLDHLRAEEAFDPEALHAEIVHLPEGRMGNILQRPLMRAYEIPYLGRSGARPEHQLSIDDLTLSLVDGKFEIRSRRLGRRIVPRLTSAHNYNRGSVGIYRLLCLLQSDGRMESCAWRWGALRSLPFLPRISSGMLVLSLATWRMTAADIATLRGHDKTGQYTAVQQWRAARRLPRWVVLTDEDNALPVDLDNVLAVESLVHLLKTRKEATLTELFPGPEEFAASGPDGRYVHELLVPFTAHTQFGDVHQIPHDLVNVPESLSSRSGDVPRPASRAASAPRADKPRVFPPGTSWIFAKLYAGAGAADRLLTEVVGPVSRNMISRGVIERWFFIRYADPDEHLRWRLLAPAGTDPDHVRKPIEQALRPLIEAGLVRRLTFDTYEREVERYGGYDSMELSEQWFWADSEAIVDTIEAIGRDDSGPELRWRVGIVGVDALLADFGLELAARYTVAQTLRERFGREFRVDAAVRKQLSSKFRAAQSELAASIERGADAESPLGAALGPLALRTERSRAVMARLRELDADEQLGRSLPVLAESYVHMYLNRLFIGDNRRHELAIYDLLAQHYRQRIAQAALNTPKS